MRDWAGASGIASLTMLSAALSRSPTRPLLCSLVKLGVRTLADTSEATVTCTNDGDVEGILLTERGGSAGWGIARDANGERSGAESWRARSPILVALENKDSFEDIMGLAKLRLDGGVRCNEEELAVLLGAAALSEVSRSDRIPGIGIPRDVADSAGPPLPRAT